MSNNSLFERLGGEAAIAAAVDLFYEKVMADERTRPFFAGLDMDAQIKKQRSFMAWAFGGPAEYKGRDLRTAHATLVAERGLSDVHFDAVAQHLKTTLEDLHIQPALIDEVLAIVGSTRAQVLSR
jgi:hemoglobin